MGPRHFCRGNVVVGIEHLLHFVASMGPRHFCRGNRSRRLLLIPLCQQLQWGHGISAVEIRLDFLASQPPAGFNGATAFLPWKSGSSMSNARITLSLQWGHGISAVEIVLTDIAVLLHILAHNASASVYAP